MATATRESVESVGPQPVAAAVEHQEAPPRNPERRMCSVAECGQPERTPGEYRRCSGCKREVYCSPACQKRHWKEHKPRCHPPPEFHGKTLISVEALEATTAAEKGNSINKSQCANALCRRQKSIDGSPLQACGKCATMSYCSEECSRDHWPYHATVCDIYLQAAAAGDRAMIADAAQPLDDKYKCAVCLEMWIDPTVLAPCNHVVCRACLVAVARATVRPGVSFEFVGAFPPCPLCRGKIAGFGPLPREKRLHMFGQIIARYPDHATAWYNLGAATVSGSGEGQSSAMGPSGYVVDGKKHASVDMLSKAISLRHDVGKFWFKAGLECLASNTNTLVIEGQGTFSPMQLLGQSILVTPTNGEAYFYVMSRTDLFTTIVNRLVECLEGSGDFVDPLGVTRPVKEFTRSAVENLFMLPGATQSPEYLMMLANAVGGLVFCMMLDDDSTVTLNGCVVEIDYLIAFATWSAMGSDRRTRKTVLLGMQASSLRHFEDRIRRLGRGPLPNMVELVKSVDPEIARIPGGPVWDTDNAMVRLRHPSRST